MDGATFLRSRSLMSNLALDLTEDLTKESAIRAAILGTPTRLPLVNCATSSR